MQSTNSDRVLISSSVFIITFMLLDAILNDEYTTIPRQAMMGLVLITMLSSLEFVGLGRIAGPFAAVIASTVFLTRGERIFTKLQSLANSDETADNGGTIVMGTIGG